MNEPLTLKQLEAVEDYRQRLARLFPEITIQWVDVKDDAVIVKLSENADMDMDTVVKTNELAADIEEAHPGICFVIEGFLQED